MLSTHTHTHAHTPLSSGNSVSVTSSSVTSSSVMGSSVMGSSVIGSSVETGTGERDRERETEIAGQDKQVILLTSGYDPIMQVKINKEVLCRNQWSVSPQSLAYHAPALNHIPQQRGST